MNLKKIVTTAAVLGSLTTSAGIVHAQPLALAKFNQQYSAATGVTVTSCALCHNSAAGGSYSNLNQYGLDFWSQGGRKSTYAVNWAALEAMTGPTGKTYLQEINAGNAPAGNGTLANPTAPAASTSGGCIASSATTPLMMVLAMLSLGFFAGRKKD